MQRHQQKWHFDQAGICDRNGNRPYQYGNASDDVLGGHEDRGQFIYLGVLKSSMEGVLLGSQGSKFENDNKKGN